MEIDIKTVVLMVGIFRLIQVFVFIYQYKTSKYTLGTGWWLMWSLAEVAAAVVILARGIPSLLSLVIIFQNPILVLGTAFLYIGVLRFFEKKVNFRFIIAFLVSHFILHNFFFLGIDNVEIRSLLLFAYISAITYLTALTLFRSKTSDIALSANAIMVIFISHGTIYLSQVIRTFAGIPSPSMFSPVFLNYLMYFDALIAGILLTFGFIIMVNQRLNADVYEAKTHFEQIFNASPDAVVISRLNDFAFIDCNESFTRMSGFTKTEMIENYPVSPPYWTNPQERLSLADLVRSKGYFDNQEVLFRRKDGEEFTGLLSARLINIKGILHVISVTRDISVRKADEEKIKVMNEKLTTLNAEKDKFFSIIAHDLINPFNIFLGLTEVMDEDLQGMTQEVIKKNVSLLRGSASNLYKLLTNLLEWSRMEQGLIPFNPEQVRLLSMVNDSLVMVQESARLKEIEIVNNIPEHINVVTDGKAFYSVFRNLVSNAVKFTPRGGKIFLSVVGNKDGNVEISIRDTGIGMNSKMIKDLFSLHGDVKRKGTEGEPSTGLGLIICKEFIEKNGGRIWVNSEEGRGSEFCFTIPAQG